MNVNMDTTALPFNQPAVSSKAPPHPTISSATATATATAATTTTTHPSNPLLFSSSSASTSNNPALKPNPLHAPADPLQHLQMSKEHPETASAPAPGAAESQAPAPAPALQSSSTNYYPHQIEGAGGPTATAPFLRDFSLVAEAAKRAQMSVVMRDLESVTL